jgi:hypothetical protein
VQVSDSLASHMQASGSFSVNGNNGGGGGNGQNDSHNNGNSVNSGRNLSGLGRTFQLVFIEALAAFGLLVARTAGVPIDAATLVRRLPKRPRGAVTCAACQSAAPPGAKFCPACAMPLGPPK